MKRKSKLVRNRIPHMLDAETVALNPTFHFCESGAAYDRYLLEKLDEEVSELKEVLKKPDNHSARELIGEMADVLQVMVDMGVDINSITSARSFKERQRGGFSSRIIMEYDASEEETES